MMSIQFKLLGAALLCALTFSLAAQSEPVSPEVKPPVASPEKIELKKPVTPEEVEARRLADEAEQKRIKEQEAKELAAKAAAEEAARQKAEAEKSSFTKLLENSKVYTGITGGLGLGLNKIHSAGYTIGMTIDYLAYKTYGFHFAAATGQYPASSGTVSSNNVPILINSNGSYGILNFDFAAVYALPVFFNLEPAVGAGVSLYQLRGGSFDFSRTVSPLIYGSLHYNLLGHLQVGLITQMIFASASKLTISGTDLPLDSSAGLTALTLQLSLRYSWF